MPSILWHCWVGFRSAPRVQKSCSSKS